VIASPLGDVAEEKQVDALVTQLGLHQAEQPKELLSSAYVKLKPGGRLIADLAEEKVLRQSGDFPYQADLSDYWSLLQRVGFQTIYVQQISAGSLEEVIKQGWTELIGATEFPVAVYRFLAVKSQ
jgi:hypothetical protein